MKLLLLSAAILSFAFTACTSENKQSSTESASSSSKKTTSVEANSGGSSTTGVVDAYLKLKNALTNDKANDAANAGTELAKAFEDFDKSSLNPEQTKEYTEIYEDAKEHAEHIAANAGNIKHQREHFETLSTDVYDLVKTVGGAQKLYYDHCPMYNNNKGANWLSETKEIKNPYLGKEMLECGTVKEELN